MNNTYINKKILRISLALFACILMIVPSFASPQSSSVHSSIPSISSDNVTKILVGTQDKNSRTELGSVSYPSDLLASNSADYLIITSDPFYTDAKLDYPIVPRYPPTVQITGIQPLSFQGKTGKVALIQGTAQDPAHDSIEWIQVHVMKYNSLNENYDEINNKYIYLNNNHGDVSWSCCMDIAPITGYYKISATASNGECSSEAPWASMWVDICVGDGFPPVAQASPKYQEVAVDQPVSFDGSGSFDPDTTPITGYTWSINGVVISDDEMASYSFAHAGSYEVSLKVSSGGGGPHSEFGTDTCTVSVVEPPVNHPPFANATPFIQGGLINEMFTFDGSTSNDPDEFDELTYSWDFGDHTTGSGSTAAHCYTAAGTYTVSLTVNDGLSSDTDTCLVIVNTIYRNKLNELAHWRSEYNGFNVSVVNVNDLGNWADPSNPVLNSDVTIKNFIDYVYNYWSAPHMSDHHVGYILFVGDTPFVATHVFMTGAADRWYGCFGDDGTGHYVGDEDYLTAEIMIGRFSVDDWNELYTNAEKTIQYEKNPEPGEWQKHTLLCAGGEIGGGFPNRDFIEETLRKINWDLSEVFYEEGGTADDVVENISDGRNIVVYCDHGGVDEWCYLNFNINCIRQLTNARKLPLVYSLACLTGSFQNASDCMGEEFLNNPNGGAVAFLGSSQVSNAGCSDLVPALFTSIIQPGNGKHIVGKIIAEGMQNVGWPEFNLLGDPALNLSLELSPLRVADAHGPYTGVVGQPVQFTGSVIGDIPPPYTWFWDFGDGTPASTEQNSSHTYDHLGTYTVTLTVNDCAGNTASNATVADIKEPRVYNVNKDRYYGLIQYAVNDANAGDTIRVSNGIYYECVQIGKSLTLIGENKDSTIIDGSGNNVAVHILATNDVTVEGFTIKNGIVGIKLEISSNNHIFNNIITKDNENSGDGIQLVGTEGISEHGTANNVISQNTISDNYHGIFVENILFGTNPTNNLIYHNNFLNNGANAYDECVGNFWNNVTRQEGNYWDDYTGTDSNGDGIGDIPYNIPGSKSKPPNQNKDMFPLVHPFVLGDMNLDGYVNWRDVDPFVLAMSDPATYLSQYHMLPTLHGDLTGDDVVNWRDIEPFVALMDTTCSYR